MGNPEHDLGIFLNRLLEKTNPHLLTSKTSTEEFAKFAEILKKNLFISSNEMGLLISINDALFKLKFEDLKRTLKSLVKYESEITKNPTIIEFNAKPVFQNTVKLTPNELNCLLNLETKVQLLTINLSKCEFKEIANFLHENCRSRLAVSFITEYFWHVFLLKGWSIFSVSTDNDIPIKLILLKIQSSSVLEIFDSNEEVRKSIEFHVHQNFENFVDYIAKFKLHELGSQCNGLKFESEYESIYQSLWEAYHKEIFVFIDNKKQIIAVFRAFLKLIFRDRIDSYFKHFGKKEHFIFFTKVHDFLKEQKTQNQKIKMLESDKINCKLLSLFSKKLEFKIFGFSNNEICFLENLIFPIYLKINSINRFMTSEKPPISLEEGYPN